MFEPGQERRFDRVLVTSDLFYTPDMPLRRDN